MRKSFTILSLFCGLLLFSCKKSSDTSTTETYYFKATINAQAIDLTATVPVSNEFEYLRPTLKPNLKKAVKQNKSNFKDINLFELGKVYTGASIEKCEEKYYLSGFSTNKNFSEIKGLLERIFNDLGIKADPGEYIEVQSDGIFFEINFSEIIEKINLNKKFKALPKYPPIVEDLSLTLNSDIQTGEVIGEIKKQNSLIREITLMDEFNDSRTFHIIYQSNNRNLKTEEITKIREKIISALKVKFGAQVK